MFQYLLDDLPVPLSPRIRRHLMPADEAGNNLQIAQVAGGLVDFHCHDDFMHVSAYIITLNAILFCKTGHILQKNGVEGSVIDRCQAAGMEMLTALDDPEYFRGKDTCKVRIELGQQRALLINLIERYSPSLQVEGPVHASFTFKDMLVEARWMTNMIIESTPVINFDNGSSAATVNRDPGNHPLRRRRLSPGNVVNAIIGQHTPDDFLQSPGDFVDTQLRKLKFGGGSGFPRP